MGVGKSMRGGRCRTGSAPAVLQQQRLGMPWHCEILIDLACLPGLPLARIPTCFLPSPASPAVLPLAPCAPARHATASLFIHFTIVLLLPRLRCPAGGPFGRVKHQRGHVSGLSTRRAPAVCTADRYPGSGVRRI